jgi:hypothetical protein
VHTLKLETALYKCAWLEWWIGIGMRSTWHSIAAQNSLWSNTVCQISKIPLSAVIAHSQQLSIVHMSEESTYK